MEALAIIRMKMIVSVVQNTDTSFLIRQKLRRAFCPHRRVIFLFLKHILKTVEVGQNGLNTTDLLERKIEEDKTDDNMEMFMDDVI